MMSSQMESSWLRLNKVEALDENSDTKRRRGAARKSDETLFLCVGEHMFGMLCLNSSSETAHSQHIVQPATIVSR